jgi:hypothetical protein
VAVSAVTLPAIPVCTDPGDDLAVAAQTVFLNDLHAVAGNFDGIGNPSRMEGYEVPHAVQAFPHKVAGHGVVGQVAIDTFDLGMDAGVKPGFVLRLHDVATAAEFGAFGFGIESGGAEGQKESQRSGDGQDDQEKEACFPCGCAHGCSWTLNWVGIANLRPVARKIIKVNKFVNHPSKKKNGRGSWHEI